MHVYLWQLMFYINTKNLGTIVHLHYCRKEVVEMNWHQANRRVLKCVYFEPSGKPLVVKFIISICLYRGYSSGYLKVTYEYLTLVIRTFHQMGVKHLHTKSSHENHLQINVCMVSFRKFWIYTHPVDIKFITWLWYSISRI